MISQIFPVNNPGSAGSGPAPVSYTHLDVYKRQDVHEVDANTMESKVRKGLYLAGELLDVDGICGGYNLQFAWSSGAIAGKCAAGKDTAEKRGREKEGAGKMPAGRRRL